MAILFLAASLAITQIAIGAPLFNVPAQEYVLDYLRKYRYLEPGESPTSGKAALSAALKRFQFDTGLKPEGILNLETLQMMTQPRCGNPSFSSGGRRKRFVPHGIKWLKRTLTWKLNDPYDLLGKYEKSVVRTTLHRAFNDWSSASKRSLRFSEHEKEDGKANFNIFFARGDHNDSLPFDGRAGIVAHGFYPTNGNLHFDADEHWTLYMADGVNLYQTAMHEIGHLLGLEHSNDYNAVMFPINRPYDPLFKLGDDDIRGIRYMYAPWAWTTCKTAARLFVWFKLSIFSDINRYLNQVWARNLASS